jgi:hypothetical protein
MNLLMEEFVPWAPRWGSSGYATEDEWRKRVGTENRNVDNRIYPGYGVNWRIITANGTPVMARPKTLEGALAAFRKLSEADRKPVVGDRGQFNPALAPITDQAPPPDTVFVDVFCRALEQAQGGKFCALKNLDCTEFGGKAMGNGIPNILSPQRESLWLTGAEVQSLLPGDRREGETYPVPTPIRLRLFLCYLYNWWSVSGGGIWPPQYLRSGELTLTVEEKSPQRIRLRLEGNALFKAEITLKDARKQALISPSETRQKDLPDPLVWSYEPRLYGTLEYDVAAKKLTRFDAVALGDYVGKWGITYKEKPVAVGFAFRLDPRDLPPESRHAPYALSALKARYWHPEHSDGRGTPIR